MDDLAAVEAAIYDQSFRALDEQARVLDALRARAAALLPCLMTRTARAAFGHHPYRLVAAYLNHEPPVSLAQYRRAIVFYNGRNFDANARQLRTLFATFGLASVCLGCEFIVWLWVLAS